MTKDLGVRRGGSPISVFQMPLTPQILHCEVTEWAALQPSRRPRPRGTNGRTELALFLCFRGGMSQADGDKKTALPFFFSK